MKPLLNLLSFLFLLSSCDSTKPVAVTYNNYQVEKQVKVDSNMLSMLQPYSDSLRHTLQQVIGFSTMGMYRKQPECELGNYITDAMKEMASQKFGKKVNMAFINYNSLRSYVPKGDVNIERMYQLVPADHILIVMDVKGEVLRILLNRIAEKGGWPVSGMTMSIKDNKPFDVSIEGEFLNDAKTYTIATIELLADGADDCDILKSRPFLNQGYLLRDAVIGYTMQMTRQGKPVDCKIEGRIGLR